MSELLRKTWRAQLARWYVLFVKYRDGTVRDHFIQRGEMDTLEDEIAARVSADMYWCVHGLREPMRQKKYAVPSKLLWMDLDAINPQALREAPTIAWCTSPGRYQAIWKCDRVVPEAVRRGFNDHCGADKGGWMLTKVLRIPGTRNHKYPDKPKVKLLYDDGPTYRVSDLEKYAVEEARAAVDIIGWRPLGDGRAIVRKYKVDGNLLDTCVPPRGGKRGQRSDVVFKLGCLLFEAGASEKEVAAALWACASFRSKWGRNLTRLWAEVGRRRRSALLPSK